MLKKSTRLICEYCNGCKKTQQLLMRAICEYCNGCKEKPTIIYETYMWVLHIWNDFM